MGMETTHTFAYGWIVAYELFKLRLKNWTEITGLSRPGLRCVLMVCEENACY